MQKKEDFSKVLSDQLQFADIPEISDLLLASQKFRFRIRGYSMYPTLKTGDLVVVQPLSGEDLQVGDVVVLENRHELMCHRLVDLFEKNGEKWVRTKGDTMKKGDVPVPLSRIVGKVISVERGGRSWSPLPAPLSLSLKDSVTLLLKQRLADRIKRVLRPLFLFLLSFSLFRLFYRTGRRFPIIFRIGIPSSQTVTPRFWRYVPSSSLFKEDMTDRYVFRFLAKVNEEVVGSLEIKAGKDAVHGEWFISHLLVRIPYRGCRIASSLLKLAFQTLHRLEASMLSVEPPPERAASSLLKSLGFEAISENPLRWRKTFPTPTSLLTPSRESFVQNAAKNLLFEQTFLELGSLFQKERIPFLVQKGMTLAYTLYPDPATRPMVDIDLYLRKEDIPKATSLLKEKGYHLAETGFEEEMLAFGGEFRFYKKEQLPGVELHWCLEQYERLKEIVRIEEEALWEKKGSYTVSGKKFFTFSPEHELFSLIIHLGYVHRFQGLKWFVDIDRWILKYGGTADWEGIFAMAKRWGMERLLCQVLLETETLLDTPLPPLPVRKRSRWLKYSVFQWLLPDRPTDRLRLIGRIFFPSREWMIYRYRLTNRSRASLYRLLHPFLVLVGKTR